MTGKTPAELQIEFLKKLKQGGASKAKPEIRSQASTPGSRLKSSRKKKRLGPGGLYFSPEAERHLQAILRSQSQELAPELLGQWVVELLSKIPLELALSGEAQRIEFFGLIQDWCRKRGIKES